MTATIRNAALLALLLATLPACVRVRVGSSEPSASGALADATALLAGGAAAWNRGDLDAFMSDYTDDATFVTPRGLVTGRAAIRGLYAARFAPGVQRDSLRFENVAAYPLGEGTMHVVAWYVLERGGQVTSRGPTSLVMRRAGSRWLIAHDHSS